MKILNVKLVNPTHSENALVNDSNAQPLEEAQGSNPEVSQTADKITSDLLIRLQREAHSFIQKMENREGFTLSVYSDSGNMLKNMPVALTFSYEKEMMVDDNGAVFMNTADGNYSVEVYMVYGEKLLAMPQQKQLGFILDAVKKKVPVNLAHELIHALQSKILQDKGGELVDRTGDITTRINTLEKGDNPLFKRMVRDFSVYFYIYSEIELHARIAEMGKEIEVAFQGQKPNTAKATEIIKASNAWKTVRALSAFNAESTIAKVEAMWYRLPEIFKIKFEQNTSLWMGVALHGFITELEKCIFRVKNTGGRKSADYHDIESVFGQANNCDVFDYDCNRKYVSGVLTKLEALFHKRAEDYKRGLLRSASVLLHKRQDPMVAKANDVQAEPVLAEDTLQEDYPTSFNMEEFMALGNFSQRRKYCEQHLQKLGEGSGRVVFAIDNDKVLKLAKNVKGIAQNGTECDHSIQQRFTNIVTKSFEEHPDELWVEMERARKITSREFEKHFGIRMDSLKAYLRNTADNPFQGQTDVDPRIEAYCRESDDIQELLMMLETYAMHINDLMTLSAWGAVRRDGQEHFVLVDFGLTINIYDNHYAHSGR